MQVSIRPEANMRSKAELVSSQILLQTVPLISTYLASEHPPHDAVDEACLKLLFNGRSKVVVEPSGPFAGLPAEMWSIIFEKLCPASTSLITAPSVIAHKQCSAGLSRLLLQWSLCLESFTEAGSS